MAEKVTIMVLKVDLQCPCCYKKIKKILCKFPQIRDQIYNEKANKVTITVVCCDPEKIRDKLCCKGAKVIKSIEIVDPPEPEKPKPPPEKPKPPPEKPKPPPEKPKPPPEKPKPPPEKPKPPPEKPHPPKPAPMGPCDCPPVRTCCGQCSEGYGGGPCYSGFPPPPPPRPCCDGYYWYGNHDRPCHVTRCDYYFTEENPQACSIM
ncbi:protein PYRICULARIA ORYZAE RESISTANCE 21-like [Salvia miltiorrhiza]|uniref:protein PYRICULARIA ORYZAE RESISTANCE 21-like n=1 Tax=Salvia miltiorrhiza TaxID=226208 RepID=UPI0025AB6866|nr:protein PYRICULARIA ORYZAE RESISTANCE 21-like [Salvia miltiorrhiza]